MARWTCDRSRRAGGWPRRSGLSAASTLVEAGPRPRAARVAVFVQFLAHGMVTALWVSHVAYVKGRLGLSNRDLGLALLTFSCGAVLAMQGIGPLMHRYGSRVGTQVSMVLLCAAGTLPAHAWSFGTLALALGLLGIGIGAADVAMNAQAAEVESRYPRPVMAAFHAAWSLTGFVGSALGGLAIHAGWPMSRTTLLGCSVVGAAALLTSRWLLPPPPKPTEPTEPAEGTAAPSAAAEGVINAELHPQSGGKSASIMRAAELGAAEVGAMAGVALGPVRRRGSSGRSRGGAVRQRVSGGAVRRRWAGRRRLPGITWLLGALCFASFLCEGAAADWAGVHLRDDLGATVGVAALGYGAFAAAMTTGRLIVDRVAGAVGGVPVLRWGGVLAAAGSVAVVLAPAPWLAFTGWALTGLGLSGVVPQLFSAAANLPGAPVTLARVTGLGYLGALSGPGIIGLLAQQTSLRIALLLLTVLACFVALGASAGLRSRG